MITAFLQIFGKILLWIYEFCHSYALSLIIFTLLSKLILFPISYRGKKSMMQMNSLQVEVQKLQKQYAKDQNRLNQETQALYEREGVNPMGGCLWSFLPLPILMGLYYIIRRPMLYMMCLTKDEITAAVDARTTLC
ncbi:MAG: YidC/Oxa1 family membrane protein insertase [Clostridiales bacterium]|nr:YidC/Oxa1 family membrane protein insertase [Clostridiales bacterium]